MTNTGSRNLKFDKWLPDRIGAIFIPTSIAGVAVARRDEYTLKPTDDVRNLFVQVLGLPYTAKWHEFSSTLTIRFEMTCTASSHKTLGDDQEELISLIPAPDEKKLFLGSTLIGVKIGPNNTSKVTRQLLFYCECEKKTVHDTYPSDR